MTSETLLPRQDQEWKPASKILFNFRSREGTILQPLQSREYSEGFLVTEGGPWLHIRVRQWSQQKLVDPLIVILRRGLEPKVLSLSAALGLALGVFPVCGVPLVLCAAVALILRANCHVPTLMLGNFAASFFELGLVVPYMRAGELVTGGEHFPLSKGEIWEALKGRETQNLMFGMLHAIVGWLVFLPATVGVLFISFLPIFKCLSARIKISELIVHPSGSLDSADGVATSNSDSSACI